MIKMVRRFSRVLFQELQELQKVLVCEIPNHCLRLILSSGETFQFRFLKIK